MAPALAVDLLERCTFPPPGHPARCAVSGGADSLALLVLAAAAGCSVTAVHVDHGLRPDGAREAEVVAAAARRWGAGFESHRVHVGAGPNLEARARGARWEVLGPGALTGHTADDQVETVLLNLLRGAGLDGLGGMAPERHPLLGLRRRETRALCRAEGLEPVADPTNDDPAHRRNRVRAELVPLASSIACRDVTPLVARQAAILREEAAYLDGLAAALDPSRAEVLAAAPPVLARRAVRRWLRAGRAHPPDAAAVARVLDVAAGRARAAEVGGGRRVRRRRGRLVLEGPAPPPVGGP